MLRKVYNGQEPPSGEYTTTEYGVNYQLLMLLKKPNGEFPVAVDHSHLWTMASETVDSIDWPLPTLYTGQYPLMLGPH